ncbi:Cytochrome c oxidase polypeptide VIa [Agyrium rufum]|nr:Cytochrome c oxidase polypeptide VIa [Agyrium rufum]
MNAQRLSARTLVRKMFSRQSALPRSIFQRRLASEHSAPPLEGAADNAFNRERAQYDKPHTSYFSAIANHRLSVTIPCLIIASINAYNLWTEHWEHWEHLPPLEERTQYSYMNIRTKKYPWGDGDKTLFWNDKVNYIKKD